MKFSFLFILTIFVLISSCSKKLKYKPNFKAHLSYLASDELNGRRATSQGDSLAQIYITENFMRMGLSPFFTDESYSQQLPIISDANVSNSSSLVFNVNGIDVILKRKRDYAISANSSTGICSGEVVFLGYGINDIINGYDDYNKISLKDKICICYLIPPKDADQRIHNMNKKLIKFTEKALLMAEQGCRAAIFVLPVSYAKHDNIPALDEKKRFRQMQQNLPIPSLRMSYSAFSKILTTAGLNPKDIDSELEFSYESKAFNVPNTTVKMNIDFEFLANNTANIAGLIEGSNTKETIVIGAHLDHIGISNYSIESDSIFNGADDNASGCSMVLELAKYYSINKPQCNLLFITFAAEEMGLLGSKHFLNNSFDQIENIKAMINFDAVGKLKNDSLITIHISSALEWEKHLNDIAIDSLKIKPLKRIGFSDSFSFTKMHIPALWFITGAENLHTVDDEEDTINYSGMESIFHFATNLIDYVVDKQLTFNKDYNIGSGFPKN